MNGSAESSAQDRDACSGVKIACYRGPLPFRRAKVPPARESASATPCGLFGCSEPRFPAFQMGTERTVPGECVVSRRPFAGLGAANHSGIGHFCCQCDSAARRLSSEPAPTLARLCAESPLRWGRGNALARPETAVPDKLRANLD